MVQLLSHSCKMLKVFTDLQNKSLGGKVKFTLMHLPLGVAPLRS